MSRGARSLYSDKSTVFNLVKQPDGSFRTDRPGGGFLSVSFDSLGKFDVFDVHLVDGSHLHTRRYVYDGVDDSTFGHNKKYTDSLLEKIQRLESLKERIKEKVREFPVLSFTMFDVEMLAELSGES